MNFLYSGYCCKFKMADHMLDHMFLIKTIRDARKRRLLQQSVLSLVMLRRRRILQVCVLALLLITSGKMCEEAVLRSCRRLQRNTGWWDKVWNEYTNERFKKTPRVSRATSQFFLGRIRHDLERDTVTEDPISPEVRLAICLYRLGRGDYYYTIAEMAGVGLSTLSTVVEEVCEAIINNLWADSVACHFPKGEMQFKEKMLDMEERWQFPCCWAAVDGCHIPIKCPAGGLEACKEYHILRNFYLIVLMGMVDAKYRFIWASCGFPGNSHDSSIMQSTDLWQEIKEGDIIPQIAKTVDGVDVPPLILRDSAFPFKTWLMRPFTNAILTLKERYFNYRLSRARMVTEGAYGQLKGRWRVLMRKCESSQEHVRTIALACIVLHNLCIDQGDTVAETLYLTYGLHTDERRDREKNWKSLMYESMCTTERFMSPG